MRLAAANYVRLFFLSLFLITLYALLVFGMTYCESANAATTSGVTSSPTATPRAAAQTATLSWQAPTMRMDGTPLAASDIAKYTVYYSIGSAPTLSSPSVDVTGATTTTIDLTLTPSLTAQTVYFAATATDTNGNESPLSAVVSKSFMVNSTAPPSAPTSVTFTITCANGCTITAQ